MKEIYVPFFEMLPKHSQLTIRMLVPAEYPELDSELFVCIAVQQGLIKKIVIDNLKDVADRVINNKIKSKYSEKKELREFKDIEVSKEFEILLDNFLYFKNQYSSKVDTNIITAYISYVLVTMKELKSYQFFQNCLYARSKGQVEKQLLEIISPCIKYPICKDLEDFGQYLTEPLIVRKYDCFGRDKIIQSCVDILCRMNKNNIILTGNPGVGKTTVVEGICNYLQSSQCPEQLRGCCVFSLDVTKLISGTMYRGDLEKRLDKFLMDLESHPNIILFIDEIHNLFTKPTGEDAGGSVHSALKTYLTKDSKIIGCTTESEYRIIETDKAFERRFSKVHVPEPTKEKVLQTLNAKKLRYEEYHKVNVSEDINKYIIKQASLYFKGRYFPDKAFDILDGSCVLCKNSGNTILEESHVDTYVRNVIGFDPKPRSIEVLQKVENTIKSKLFGQDESVEQLTRCLKRYFLGVSDKTRPIASVLFVGPTGTGKTEMCKLLANSLFTPESFVRYDMSEFMEAHSVSKFIGSPPGYVGYNQGGNLTQKVDHNPFCVILLDEVEKAHKDVMNILLQIMDDGRLTDSSGKVVDFCNCIIVMTSNIGCRELLEKQSIGFNSNNSSSDVLQDAINNYFSPEFRNRLDCICYFNKISREVFDKVFEKELQDFISLYNDVDITLNISQDTIQMLKEKCLDEKNGVRFIRRKITTLLEDKIFQQNPRQGSVLEL